MDTSKPGIVRNRGVVAVGVTGGIGSGKSDVCEVFARLGAIVTSADRLARELMETHPELKAALRRAFGPSIYLRDGTLDRQLLADKVFGHPALERRLNATVHPTVIQRIQADIQRLRRTRKAPLICVEAALLYEAKTEFMFDYVVVVDAPRNVRIRRVMKRDGATRAEILRRMSAQIPPRAKATRADFVLLNTGSLRDLERSSRFLYHLLVRLGCNREPSAKFSPTSL